MKHKTILWVSIVVAFAIVIVGVNFTLEYYKQKDYEARLEAADKEYETKLNAAVQVYTAKLAAFSSCIIAYKDAPDYEKLAFCGMPPKQEIVYKIPVKK